jgi:multiple sugar transport system ATP-binding protein
MRTELERLHHRLGTTTVYVTHDQVEAMTLGDRVAVMRPVSAKRPHNLQQVARPNDLYNNPRNLFVAGFIGSPAMNMAYATLESENGGVWVRFAGERVEVNPRAVDRHKGLEDYMGETIVIGIRPTDFEAISNGQTGPGRALTANIDVAEMLGSETFAHFLLDERPVVTPDIEELLADTGATVASLGDRTRFTARLNPDIRVRTGDQIDLALDTSKMHFFDATTGDRIGAPTTAEDESPAVEPSEADPD